MLSLQIYHAIKYSVNVFIVIELRHHKSCTLPEWGLEQLTSCIHITGLGGPYNLS